jgi:hypothetical protein
LQIFPGSATAARPNRLACKTGARPNSGFFKGGNHVIESQSNSLIFPTFWLSPIFHGQKVHVQALLHTSLVQRIEFIYFGNHAIFLIGK